ncbi:GEM-like protein 1 [Acorus gramineus]|uniref:GEM-like protein 1 n=1 Tax=Acorus gramineus TaxID=55184 RepID=A0AAV9BQV5_ACOGR|nr:GEM-like protein 1 [Acorus gramineus]
MQGSLNKGGEEGRWGTWVMGTPVQPQANPANQQAATWVAVEYAPSSSSNPSYMNYSVPPPPTTNAPRPPLASNPYVHTSPIPGSSGKSRSHGDNTERAESLRKEARSQCQKSRGLHREFKTGPSVTDAAMARISQGTRVLAEGGHDKVFQHTFGIFPGERLQRAYVCYLSTSSGPVIGTLYLSTARLAFCSDNPVCRVLPSGQQEWVYYKVVIQIDQLMAVTPSANPVNRAEKYIQIITSDGHEFWFMGFVSYDKALNNLTKALQHSIAHRS